jgi:hypothetical protein
VPFALQPNRTCALTAHALRGTAWTQKSAATLCYLLRRIRSPHPRHDLTLHEAARRLAESDWGLSNGWRPPSDAGSGASLPLPPGVAFVTPQYFASCLQQVGG